RIGRTGRAGKAGRSFTLAAPEDGKAVAAIEKLIGKGIPTATADDIASAELDFTGGDRRRGRGRSMAEPRGERPRRGRSSGSAADASPVASPAYRKSGERNNR